MFVIRYVEKRIDRLLNPAILDHSPLPSEFDGIQFESEWSIFRSLTPKKRSTPTQAVAQSAKNGIISSPSLPGRSPSPVSSPPPGHRSFASLRHNFSRSHGGSSSVSLQSMFNDVQAPQSPSPISITSAFDALQTFLILSGTNPALITQIWSQVFYWLACESSSMLPIVSLNPVAQVKYSTGCSLAKNICAGVCDVDVVRRVLVDVTSRSRAIQVGMNLSVLEEWIETVNLPRGIMSHLAPVRDLLNWLQVRSLVRPRCCPA